MAGDARLDELRRLGARIGEGVFFGPNVYVEREFAALLTIEDGVVLASGVSILLHDSALNNVAGEPLKFGCVSLRAACYVGANATVLCGVDVGAGAVVGAGALVSADVPSGAVAYGNPARVRGTVSELAAKHRRLRAQGDRFHYLEQAPWRDHMHGEPARLAAERIAAFVGGIAAKKER
jgi:acetyltransferase-like isoleucine patch superfamily enzyme